MYIIKIECGGILNINVDSLEIEHNIDKSNEFIGLNARGKDVHGLDMDNSELDIQSKRNSRFRKTKMINGENK